MGAAVKREPTWPLVTVAIIVFPLTAIALLFMTYEWLRDRDKPREVKA